MMFLDLSRKQAEMIHYRPIRREEMRREKTAETATQVSSVRLLGKCRIHCSALHCKREELGGHKEREKREEREEREKREGREEREKFLIYPQRGERERIRRSYHRCQNTSTDKTTSAR